MKSSKQTVSAALNDLGYLDPSRPATLHELIALSSARARIDELMHACITELRADDALAPSWKAIAFAAGSSSSDAARQKYSEPFVGGHSETPVLPNVVSANGPIVSFWLHFADRFAWDVLPMNFLYALYSQWMADEHPADTPRLPKAFARHIRDAATASGEWTYARSRPGSLMDDTEPLLARLPQWSRNETDEAVHGLRRTTSVRRAAGVPRR